MRKCGLCCRPVSVRPSVTLAEDIVKLLSRPGSQIILVFDPSAGTQFQEEPLQRGGANTRGREFLRFSNEIAVYLGYGKIYAHSCYGTLIGSYIRSIEW